MTSFRTLCRWAAILALGAGVVVGAWLVAVQLMLAVWDPMGTWQRPRIFQVTLTQVSRDVDRKLTGQVLALEGEKVRDLTFSKEECAELEGEDQTWVLQNYRAEGNRPSHFRLTPTRLILEYPEPWMLLALWVLWQLRRQQLQAAQKALPVERKVWRDDFHERSERFIPPQEPKVDGRGDQAQR